MPRAKTRVASRQRRKKILKRAAGFQGKRRNNIRVAQSAVWRAGQYAFRDRRQRKRDFRALWIMRINAAARMNGITYGRLIDGLRKKGMEINRKILAHFAMHDPDTFSKIVAAVRS